MKTYNGLFDEIVSLENLYISFERAQTNNRWDIERLEALEGPVENVIDKLHRDLANGRWIPDRYRRFTVFNGVKMRNVDEPSYRDRILHRAIVDRVHGLFENKFIGTSYAVTREKGQHRAVKKVKHYVQRELRNVESVYVFQGDVHHYYESIRHDILLEQIRHTIRDKKLIAVWKSIIDGYHNDYSEEIGIPIGAVVSQLSANIYLNPFDHYVKEKLRCKYYARYMDDFVVIETDKRRLRNKVEHMEEYLKHVLKLELNERSKLYSVVQGIDFCGFRIFKNRVLPRKKNVRAAKARLKRYNEMYRRGEAEFDDVDARIQSYRGMMKYSDARRTYYSTVKIFRDLPEFRERI